MSSSIVIRPYSKEDRSALLSILKKNVPRYFHEDEVEDFEKFIDKHGAIYFTVLYENQIAGGVSWTSRIKEKTAMIAWIFFDPECQGKGLGRESINFCLSAMSKVNEVEKFRVRTSQLVYPFFEKFGFKTIYVEQDYWAKGFDLYDMEMDAKDYKNSQAE